MRGAAGAFVLYKNTDKNSFDSISHWINSVKSSNLSILLVGINETDESSVNVFSRILFSKKSTSFNSILLH